MKTRLLILVALVVFNMPFFAQTIWNGPTITFTKANFANPALATNQDRITSNVWITRGSNQGIYNIYQESSYDKMNNTSPEDTEWAYGTTSILGTLTFDSWYNTVGGSPPTMVNQNMVVHLITDDIYIDIKFTSWSSAASGGGFSYQRSTDSGLGTKDFSISKFTIYPNPGNHEIKLNLSNSETKVSIQVFDMLGKEVYSKTEYESPINVSSWAKGMYLVRVSDSQGAQIKTFIKN